MPAQRPSSKTVTTRARYARSSGDMLLNDTPPFMWWYGLDSGGGAYPIGPNGPYASYGPGRPVVTRATALITGPLTAAPFRVLDTLAFGGQPTFRPRWMTDPMLLRPDSRYLADVYPEVVKLPRSSFWAEWLRSAIWWGTGAFLTQLDETGGPLAGSLRLVNSALLSTERDQQGGLHWVLGSDAAYDEQAVFSRDGYLSLGPVTYRLVTLRNPHSPVDAEGHSMGVFEMNPAAFQLAGQVDEYASGTFRSGIPAGYLKVDQSMNSMTQEQANELKTRWLASHGGDRRSIAVLNAFTSFVPLNLSPVDAALGEVKRLNIADVAFAFGLDPMTLGAGLNNSATYTNLRDSWANHRDFGLAPWQSAVEDTLTALLPGTQGVKVDLDRFANPPPQERFTAYATAINSGVMTANEARELEGLPPLPEPVVPPQLVADDEETEPEPELEESRGRRPQPWRRIAGREGVA